MNVQNMISLENRHQVLNLVRVLLFPTFCCLRSILFDELILGSIHKLYGWAAGMGRHICYLPAGRSVIVKNCDRGLENVAFSAFSRPRSQFFTIRTDPKPVNNLFIFFAYKKSVSIFVNTRTKSHESVTVARGQI